GPAESHQGGRRSRRLRPRDPHTVPSSPSRRTARGSLGFQLPVPATYRPSDLLGVYLMGIGVVLCRTVVLAGRDCHCRPTGVNRLTRQLRKLSCWPGPNSGDLPALICRGQMERTYLVTKSSTKAVMAMAAPAASQRSQLRLRGGSAEAT